MPWCPKCKTEYIEGIELCADCHTPLVASLDEDMHEALINDSDCPEEMSGEPEEIEAQTGSENDEDDEDTVVTGDELRRQLSHPTITYVKPEEQYKDTKSSGYMLTFIGAAGAVALVLIAAGVIPIALDPVMQYVFYSVLGILFLVFFVMGVNALKKAGEYKARIEKEGELEHRLLLWLCEDAQKTRIDACRESEGTMEEAYFACQDLMKQLITEKEPGIKEDYMNYLIEKAYSRMYEA